MGLKSMCEWKPDFYKLDERVDGLDKRLTSVEASVKDMRDEIQVGFADLKTELGRIYDERAKWGEWGREHLGRLLGWIGVIVLSACGITQLDKIVAAFH